MTEEFDQAVSRYIDQPLREETQERHLAALRRLSAPRPRSQRRRLTLAAALAVGVMGAGLITAASLGAFSTPVGNHGTAHCYTTVDLNDADNHNDFGVAVSDSSPTVIGDAAAEAMEYCRSQWADGRFRTTTPTFPDYASGPATFPVPPLVACVLDNGEVAIFPGSNKTCAELGIGTAQM